MRIGSAERRLYWKAMLIGSLADVFVAGAIAWFFKDRESWIITTALVWLLIQAADIALSLLRWLRVLLVWQVGAFNPVRASFRSLLEENGLPKPEPYEESVDDYLTVAAFRESEEPNVRVAAATMLGFRSGMKSFAGMTRSTILNRMHEKGLEDFAER